MFFSLTGVVGLEYNGDTYYYIKNIQDDVIGLLNSNNEKVVSYEYDSWGKVLSIKDNLGQEIIDENHIGIINPYRYRSYYYDTETKLYYLNSRYYNPEWKRFINADGMFGSNEDMISYNIYTYCSNNPIFNCDTSGEFALGLGLALKVTCAVVAAVVVSKAVKKVTSAAVGVVSNVISSSKALSTTKTKAKVQASTATKTVATVQTNSFESNLEENKTCTTAVLINGDVARGQCLTIQSSISYVQLGGNVMCDNEPSAKMVALAFPYPEGPEIHNKHVPGNNYYYHYHPDRNSHRHIWFYQ